MSFICWKVKSHYEDYNTSKHCPNMRFIYFTALPALQNYLLIQPFLTEFMNDLLTLTDLIQIFRIRHPASKLFLTTINPRVVTIRYQSFAQMDRFILRNHNLPLH